MSDATDQQLVERVEEITGASFVEAKYLLGACNNDAEAAIALFFEKGGAEDVENGNGASSAIPIDDDQDEIRAPIAPIREQMIGPEDDNFMTGMSTNAPRFVRPSQRIKICPLRDFAREGALMEEQLQQAAYNNGGISTSSNTIDHNTGTSSRRRARAAFVATSVEALQNAPPGSSRLGDLYRPPTDIAYAGNFQAARNRAMAIKHWLLVNVQNDNFDSQLLNRDVWSNKELRKLVRKRFILWQIDSESIEGRRFITFYHCNKLPYVCIIDPRTGEEVWKSTEPKESTLLQDLNAFVLEHNDFAHEAASADDDETPSTSKRAAVVCDDSPVRSETINVDSMPDKRPRILELSEDEQIALAIRNSIRENGIKAAATSSTFNGKKVDDEDDDNNSEFGSVEEFGDEDDDDRGLVGVNDKNNVAVTKNVSNLENYEEQLGSAKDDLTMLKLRLLNADGNDETVLLRWPSDTRLKVLRLYLEQKHSHLTQRNYKLICAFPRKTLSSTDNELSLKELGLHPSANIHVTDDDD